MDRENELAIVLRTYAKHVLAAAGVADRRIENAFAALTAPAYSERRSVLAKELGLGRKRAEAETPARPRRGRRPQAATE